MLVLTRRIGESIVIGNNIIITVIGANPNNTQIKIGITAPKEISVHREEIYQRIKSELDVDGNAADNLIDAENEDDK